MVAHTLLSSGTHLAAKVATAEASALSLVVLRLTAAALIFTLVIAMTPGPRLPARRHWPSFIAFGFVAGPLNQGLFLWGVQHSNATHASLLYALTPIGVYLVSLALRREARHPRRFIGAAVAFTGVLLLFVLGDKTLAGGHWWGDLAILGAVAAWVAWTIEARRLSPIYGGLRTSGWATIAGSIWLLPGFALIDWPELGAADATLWACLGYLVLGTSVVSYVLWNWSLARVDASRVAIFTNLQPVATALLAFVLLGEHLGWETALGGLLVLVGVRVAQS